MTPVPPNGSLDTRENSNLQLLFGRAPVPFDTVVVLEKIADQREPQLVQILDLLVGVVFRRLLSFLPVTLPRSMV